MDEIDKPQAGPRAGSRAFDKLMDEIRAILIDGIKHGFFNGEIVVEKGRAGRREVLISAGKSYRHLIELDDLPS